MANRFVVLISVFMLNSCGNESTPPKAGTDDGSMLVLYASLPAERVARVADAYREATGTLVNYMLDSGDVLIDKLIRKEHRPGADVLMVSGAGHLVKAVDSDVLRPTNSATLDASIADALRHPDGYWFGIGFRAELIVYDSRSVDLTNLGGYADLGNDDWLGKLCLQRSINERMRSLVAALIAESGEREAELVARGWRSNLATSVFDEQRDLLQAIESGQCTVGIVSSDEVARFVNEGLAKNLHIHLPTADDGGTWRQLTAAGVTRHANDAELARNFVEWLASPAGQLALHANGSDYPTDADIPLPAPLDSWTTYAISPIGVSRAGYHFEDAILLLERARLR